MLAFKHRPCISQQSVSAHGCRSFLALTNRAGRNSIGRDPAPLNQEHHVTEAVHDVSKQLHSYRSGGRSGVHVNHYTPIRVLTVATSL